MQKKCHSQGRNPKTKIKAKARTFKAKTEAKARTFKAKTEAKAWTLEAKTKDTNLCPRGSSRPRPVLEDYITAFIYTSL